MGTKKKLVMPEFIVGLYSVVIGVSSLKLVSSFDDVVLPGHTWPLKVLPGHDPISLSDLIFKIIFLGFTLLIAAHDWFTYHDLKRVPDGNKRHHFWSFAPSIGCLFCLAQMLLSAANNEMIPWYGAGIGYTLFNVWNRRNIANPAVRIAFRLHYFFHIAICVIAIALLWGENETPITWIHWVILVGTIGIVVALWSRIDKVPKNNPDKEDEHDHQAAGATANGRQSAKQYTVEDGILTHKQLLQQLNDQHDEEKKNNRNLIITGVIGGLIAAAVLTWWIYDNPRYQNIAMGVFGTSSVVGAIAATIYLLMRQDEIDHRNTRLLRKIEKGMSSKGPLLDDDFYKKLTVDKLDVYLKETPENPLKP